MNNNSKGARKPRQYKALLRLNKELLKGEKMHDPSIGNIKRIEREMGILKSKLN